MAARAAAPLKVKLEAALVVLEGAPPLVVGVPLSPLPLLTLGGRLAASSTRSSLFVGFDRVPAGSIGVEVCQLSKGQLFRALGKKDDLRRVDDTNHSFGTVLADGAVDPDWIGVGDVDGELVTLVKLAGVE